jgi:hypothetical protein
MASGKFNWFMHTIFFGKDINSCRSAEDNVGGDGGDV